MTSMQAAKLIGTKNPKIAKTMFNNMTIKTPIRYKVAAKIIINS
jgi:hypothetical protein